MSDTQNIPAHLFNQQEQQQVLQLLNGFTHEQLHWLNGYLTGLQHGTKNLLQLLQQQMLIDVVGTSSLQVTENTTTILYGSKSGNSKKIAQQLAQNLQEHGIKYAVKDMNDYSAKSLLQEKNLLVIVSTHGEGDPPPAAEDLYTALLSRSAAKLPELKFAVLALGDKSYTNFCQTGNDFDKRLKELGGTQLFDRTDCDVEFEEDAQQWIEKVTAILKAQKPASSLTATHTTPTKNGATNGVKHPAYSRKKPFEATVLEKIQLNGRGSAKETYHVELSLEGSGITYEPGDTLGVFVQNDKAFVHDFIQSQQWNAAAIIEHKDAQVSFEDFLVHHVELTTVSGILIEKYLQLAKEKNEGDTTLLQNIFADKPELNNFVYGKDVWDIFTLYPIAITEQEAAKLLMPLQPRLYSIASSLLQHPEEVHITVAKVAYQNNNRLHKGVASNHIANALTTGSVVKVFVEKNESFKLPANDAVPTIMIGPGTGIAPFRAFVEERAAIGTSGKNWLFFGDQHFTTDFLYQTEWQRYNKQGVLHKINTAFSRDTTEKIYVQHRLQQHAAELYKWLQEGAHIYVCGDAKRMAKDVKQTIIHIVKKEGNHDEDYAIDFVKKLIKQGRYQEDVY